MKTKKELFEILNNLVISEIYHICPEVQKPWEDTEFQKKIALTIGLKHKDIANIPKRNKSSYLFFCQELRGSIVEENPGIKPNQVMVMLGKKWSGLTEEEKKVYDTKAMEDKQRYLSLKENNKRSKPMKISSYLQFCGDERSNLKKQFPELHTKEITAKLGALWNEYKLHNSEMLKSKYGYIDKDDSAVKIVPSIPANISSRNTKAIKEIIKC